jgi:RHS repeat-associated protein
LSHESSKYLARSIISVLGLLGAGTVAAQQCYIDGWTESCYSGTVNYGSNCEVGPGGSSYSGCDSYTWPEQCFYEPSYTCDSYEDDPSSSGDGGSGDGGSDSGEVAQTVMEFEVNCDDASAVSEVTERPVVIATGQKLLSEMDFVVGGNNPIPGARLYNSFSGIPGVFGPKWHALWEYSLEAIYADGYCGASFAQTQACAYTGTPTNMVLVRKGGTPVTLTKNAQGDWVDENADFNLRAVIGGWNLVTKDGATEKYNTQYQATEVLGPTGTGWRYTYNAAGALTRLTHTSGRYVDVTWSGGKVATMVAPGARTFAFQYNTAGTLTGVTYPGGLGTRTYHYENGALPYAVTGVSVNGVRHTRYSYHYDGRAYESGLEGGNDKSTFTYADGYTDVTNATGATTRYTVGVVDGGKRITRVDRPASAACAGGTVTSEYGTDAYLDYEIDAAGNKTEFVYDAAGILLTKITGIAPSGDRTRQKITDFVWDAAGMLLLGKREYGATRTQFLRETSYEFYPVGDAAGRGSLIKQVTVHDRTSTATPQASRTVAYNYTFHANRQISVMTVDGPLAGTGDVTRYAYTALGELASITNPLGHVTTFSNFNASGQPGRQTDANGLTTDFVYDAKGRVTRTTVNGPDGPRVTSVGYDAFDQVTSLTDAAGRTINYRYDAAMRPVQVTADALTPAAPMFDPDYPATDSIALSYNLLNKLTSRRVSQLYHQRKVRWVNGEPEFYYVEAEALYNLQTWNYDAGGHLQTRVGNAGQRASLTYNGNEDLLTSTDASSRTTSYVYDTHRRITEVRAPNGAIVKYEYDTYGRLVKVTDAAAKVSTYTYNGFGEVLTAKTPPTGLLKFEYDVAGRRTKVTRPDGSFVTSTYDVLGRATRRDATPATGQGATAQAIVVTYDTCAYGKGRLCRFDDPSGSTSYAYRQSGEMASQTAVIDGVTYSMQYGYDALGRLATTTYSNGVILRNTYNSASKVTMVEAYLGGAWVPVISNGKYQSFGPQTAFTFGNGISRLYSFDTDGRLTAIKSGSTGPQDLVYGYDTSNNLTSITNARYPTLTQTFTYTNAGELKTANSTGAAGNQAFGYDMNGNRTTHSWPGGSRTLSYSTTNDRLSSTSGTGARSYTYDANGNPQSILEAGATLSLRYDGFGNTFWLSRNASQVMQVANGAGTVALAAGTWTHGFNALGQRVTKDDAAVAGKRRYVYDVNGNLVGESLEGSSQLDSIYVWHGGSVVALIRGGQLYFVHGDHLGRAEMITNSAKAIVWRAENTAFDRRVVLDSIGGFNIGLPGQYYDYETALWHNTRRTYDAQTGRYLQADPMGLQAGLNLYAYVGNDPLSSIDPLGLRQLTECETKMLQPYFPKVDLSEINIEDGIPYLARKFGAENADAWTFRNSIYMAAGQGIPDTIDGISLIGHEIVHTQQYAEHGVLGMAWGYWRSNEENLDKGMSEYDAYRYNKFEVPAWDMGARIDSDLRARAGSPCECFQ